MFIKILAIIHALFILVNLTLALINEFDGEYIKAINNLCWVTVLMLYAKKITFHKKL